MYIFNIKCDCFIRNSIGAFYSHASGCESSSKQWSPYSGASCVEKVVGYVNMFTGTFY